MKLLLSSLLVALVLLQTFSRELLVADYALNQATITARFCVNKSRPQLRCNGKCYFAKQLKKQQEREQKAPNLLKAAAEMLPAAYQSLVPARPVGYPVAARYRPLPAPGVSTLEMGGIFHPPQAA